MITKHYTIYCEECANTIPLRGQSVKECEEEVRRINWNKRKGHWYCPTCDLQEQRKEVQGE
jgi:hypothetical protein